MARFTQKRLGARASVGPFRCTSALTVPRLATSIPTPTTSIPMPKTPNAWGRTRWASTAVTTKTAACSP